MNSLGLALFADLCALGNTMEKVRDCYAPMSQEWTTYTELLGHLDAAIDLLVLSDGIDDEEGEDHP